MGAARNGPDLFPIFTRSPIGRGRTAGLLDLWPTSLSVGQPFPTVFLWLLGELPIPIDLETTYEEIGRVLRIC
jgi:hypothetical protein